MIITVGSLSWAFDTLVHFAYIVLKLLKHDLDIGLWLLGQWLFVLYRLGGKVKYNDVFVEPVPSGGVYLGPQLLVHPHYERKRSIKVVYELRRNKSQH